MKVSVVCPFFNESAIIERAAEGILASLATLGREYELIVVDDGSTDDGRARLEKVLNGHPHARVVSYPQNEGRGHALATGIAAATGDVIVTTEIDLSWGERVVHDIVDKLEREPALHAVVASPNLPGGGYRNVPARRVWLSRMGNRLIRLLFVPEVTMNTGMTRGYRREVIQRLRFDEKGKEFHLEVLLKLIHLGYRVGQVPAVLEWKDHKLQRTGAAVRKSSTNIPRIIGTHLRFAVFANPIRYFWGLALVSALLGLASVSYAFVRLLTGQVAIFMAIMAMFFAVFSLLFFAFGVLTQQQSQILRELWRGPPKPDDRPTQEGALR